jgi:hypothetical protein
MERKMRTHLTLGLGFVALLAAPFGTADAAPAGAYLSSYDGSMVQRFNLITGAYEATLADSADGLNGAIGLTFGHDGALYVASYNNDSVLRVDPDTAAVTPFITAGGNPAAQDLIYHAGHDRYYLNPDNIPQADRYTNTGAPDGSEPTNAFSYRVKLGPDGRLYGTNTSATFRNVWVYDFNTDTVASFTDHSLST